MATDLALARGTDSLASAWANAVNNMALVLENVLGRMSSDLEKGPGRMNLGWGNGKGRMDLGSAKEIMDLDSVNEMDSSSGLVLGREISRE